MNAPIVQKIEICFWDLMIYLLTHNPLVRHLVKQAALIPNHREVLTSLVLILSGGLVGLLVGFILPLILHNVR